MVVGYTETMIAINIEEMQRDLSGYLQRVTAGETLLIVQGDKPIAELKPIAPVLDQLRPFGLCAGQFTVPPDFDGTLPGEVLAEFEGS